MTWTPDDRLEGPAQPGACFLLRSSPGVPPSFGFRHNILLSFPQTHQGFLFCFVFASEILLYKDYELSQPSLSSLSSLALFHPSGFNPNTIFLEIVFLKWPPPGVLSHHITFINSTYQDQKWLLSPTSPSCKLHRVRDANCLFISTFSKLRST